MKSNTCKFIDIAAAVGGLLGLGVGFSFISLVEILYFFGVPRSKYNNEVMKHLNINIQNTKVTI